MFRRYLPLVLLLTAIAALPWVAHSQPQAPAGGGGGGGGISQATEAVNDNDTDLSWRNNADTADIPVLSVDTSDDTILGIDNGDLLIFDWANGFPRYTFDQSGTMLLGGPLDLGLNFHIRHSTVDGTDDGFTVLSSGGTNNVGRGAFLALYGNESSNTGLAELKAGDASGIVRINNFDFNTSGVVESGGNIEFNAAGTDGSDTFQTEICGGGECDVTRGAFAAFYGNETGQTGRLRLSTGDNASSQIELAIGSTLEWTVANNGDLTNNSDNNVIVQTEVYGAGWNGSNEVPTKDALYDKIETLGGGVLTGGALGVDYYDHNFTWPAGSTTSTPLATETITHSVGRPPDMIEVFANSTTNGWYAHRDFHEIGTNRYGWDVFDDGAASDENNIIELRLFANLDSSSQGGIARLYWFTDDSITAAPSTGLKTSPTKISVDNNLLLDAGTSLSIEQGTPADACAGTSTLNGTTAVTISTTCVDTGALIFITRTSFPTAGGNAIVTNIVNGVSFDIDSDNASDDSTINWLIVNDS